MNPISDIDALRQTLALAHEGIGLTSPNPCVGAVVLDRQRVRVGAGSHRYAGLDHAEVLALRQAGSGAEGGTLFVNLEPCSHTGRTSPCVDAIVAAKISRVVATMRDPNPAVGGEGFAKLRQAGISVDVVGETQAVNEEFMALRRESLRLNESFARYIAGGLPLVTLKAAMTLDGKIALQPGVREEISGAESRARVQEMRHASDAILTGIGTVMTDDPLLTDRSSRPRRRPLLRAVVDSALRIPPESALVRTAKDDLIVFCASPGAGKREELERRGVRVVVREAASDGRVDLRLVLQYLAGRQITSVLLEGGAVLNGAALSAGLVDKVTLFVSPRILGDVTAVPLASGAGFAGLGHAAALRNVELSRFGADFAVEGYFRDPYEVSGQGSN